MKFFYKKVIVLSVVVSTALSCKENKDSGENEVQETMVAGKTTILVDNTVQPIIEDVLAVFHSVYDRATIRQVNMSETEVVQALLRDSSAIAVLPRKLTAEEGAYFTKRNIVPKVEEFATDAIALITNKRATDSVIELQEVLNVLRGKGSAKVSKLVFDNANSSTVQYLLKEAGVTALPATNVYALKTNEEVIKYVHDNNGAVGIIGLNWLLQPTPGLEEYVENITVLGVDNVNLDKGIKKYYKPNQTNLATGSYPLTRKLYVLNYQGRQGLGMGFASYIGGIEGQRIILKSGLLPVRIPTREISVRNELETTE